MFGAIVSLLLHGYYLCLRVTGRGGSFPRPLTQEEEDEALTAMAGGDAAARERGRTHNEFLHCSLSIALPHPVEPFNKLTQFLHAPRKRRTKYPPALLVNIGAG